MNKALLLASVAVIAVGGYAVYNMQQTEMTTASASTEMTDDLAGMSVESLNAIEPAAGAAEDMMEDAAHGAGHMMEEGAEMAEDMMESMEDMEPAAGETMEETTETMEHESSEHETH